jgi:rhamnose utilization protein RhaD (predicted bifunctional aldolase and dehydrogenase)
VLDAVKKADMEDDAVKRVLKSAVVEGSKTPSIETFLHALCLQLDGVQYVGHTHPTVAVSLLSSSRSREWFSGSLFPDQIVMLGPAMVYVPYADPGLPLAHAVQDHLRLFTEREQRVPRVILLENHGVIALGNTAKQVVNVSIMLTKVCRVLAGSMAAGGPRFLAEKYVTRIDRRPDELARRADLK